MMTPVQRLRNKAALCCRLAQEVGSPRDVTLLEALGADADQAADDMEAEEAVQSAVIC